MIYTVACVGVRKCDLTYECVQALKSANEIILHTANCGCSEWLNENGIGYISLDSLYDSAEDFDTHADMAAASVLTAKEGVVYCVIDFSDESVKRIIASGARVHAIGAGIHSDLLARAGKSVLRVAASNITEAQITSACDTLVTEIDTRELAGDTKLRLMEHYPEDMPIYLITSSGDLANIRLSTLDRLKQYNHFCACLVPAVNDITVLERYDFYWLMCLVKCLRDTKNGCKWDAEQTHESLANCMIEEAYEVKDACINRNSFSLCEELGDLLFVTALQMQIAVEHSEFNSTDVITGIVEKMIRRHKHVFGGEKAESVNDLMDIWAREKRSEKGFSNAYDEMRAIAKCLPALLRAQKVVKRSGLPYIRNASLSLDNCDNAERLGDALMEIVKWAQNVGLNAETALENAIERFINGYR